jgi:hypothetical protein
VCDGQGAGRSDKLPQSGGYEHCRTGAEVLTRYASVTGTNYKNDQTTYEALRDYVIPLYERFIRPLRALHPEAQEVRDLNRIYIEGTESLLDGFKVVMIAIETKDRSLIRPANEYSEKGRIENEKWRSELIALGGEHDVKFEKKEGGGSRILDLALGHRETRASEPRNHKATGKHRVWSDRIYRIFRIIIS